MKKKLINTIKLYLTFLLVSIVLYSCCSDTYQIRSFQSLSIYNLNNNQKNQENTVVGEFVIEAQFTDTTPIASNFKETFIQSAYATSCDEEYLNQLVNESLIIKLDKDFVYNGNTVNALSNLYEIPQLKNNIVFGYNAIYINFLNEFIDNAIFENQEYTFTVYIETNDGLQLEKQISVAINL